MKPSPRVLVLTALTALLVAALIVGVARWLGPGDPQDDLLPLPKVLTLGPAAPRGAPHSPEPADPNVPALPDLAVPHLATPGSDAVTVVSLQGRAELRRSMGDWVPMTEDGNIRPGDQLRTSAQASLKLQFGGASTLTLGANSELELVESRQREARWSLLRGYLALRSLTRDKDVRVRSSKGGPRLQIRNAQLEILRVSSILAASNLRGEVKLISKRRALNIPEGLMSWAIASKRPANPKVLVKQAALKLRPLRKTETDDDKITVRGSANFLAEIWVNEQALSRRGARRFAAKVPLELGAQTITVRAQVPGGEAVVETLSITRVEASPEESKTSVNNKKRKKKKRKFKATVRWGH